MSPEDFDKRKKLMKVIRYGFYGGQNTSFCCSKWKKTTHELLKHLTMLSRKKFQNPHYHFETIKIKYHSLPYFVSNKKKAKTGSYDIRRVTAHVFGKRNYWRNTSSLAGDSVWITISPRVHQTRVHHWHAVFEVNDWFSGHFQGSGAQSCLQSSIWRTTFFVVMVICRRCFTHKWRLHH